MRVYFRGKNDDVRNSEMRYAFGFFCQERLSSQLSRNITLYVHWRAYPGEWGSCDDRDSARPRVFTINLRPSMTRVQSLRTAAHEFGHVEQYALGRLTCDGRWKKRLIDEEVVPYDELPWEREAVRIEKLLYKKYKTHLEREGVRWQRDFR